MIKLVKNFAIIVLCFGSFLGRAAQAEEPYKAQEILRYWFGVLDVEDIDLQQKTKLWFEGGKDIDKDIQNLFEQQIIEASEKKLDFWQETPKGRLALILLMDQFTRNVYRGTPEAFAFDDMAQKLALDGIALGHDLELLPIERVFFYLPLEHAENRDLQKLCIEKMRALLPLVSKEQNPYFIQFENYAQKHYEIIKKFGRFPYRNKVLDRTSTPEEKAFLESFYAFS